MKNNDLRRRAWSGPAPTDARTPACLDEETLGALAEGTLDEATRSGVLPHLADCARCRTAVASLARALAAPDLRREVAAVTSRSGTWRSLARWSAVAAAVLLVLLVPLKLFRNQPAGPHRSPAVMNGAVPASLTPEGDVAQVEALRWAPVLRCGSISRDPLRPQRPHARRGYPADPVVVLPDSVALVPGVRYLWKVEARVGFDRWVSSSPDLLHPAGSARP